MQQELPSDAEVGAWLKTLGVESLCAWDVLVFLYRHQSSLVSAEHIARLLGYATAPVVEALEVLESLGLVKRSREAQGARLYRLTGPTEPPDDEAFERLLDLAGHRAGRLLLSKQLRRGGRTSPEGAGGSKAWLKAI
jgi:DNA-binding transcriptional ArsR family regulator